MGRLSSGQIFYFKNNSPTSIVFYSLFSITITTTTKPLKVKDIFEKYLDNTCTASETVQVLLCIKTDEGRKLMDSLLVEKQDLTIGQEPDNETADRIWANIQSYTSSIRESAGDQPNQTRVKPLWAFRFGWVAAAALVPLIMVGVYFYSSQNKISTLQLAERADYGQTRSLTLSDGSVVVLNGNSTLKYAKNWSKNEVREVWLTGEAFFRITHKANNQRFLVHTNRNHLIEVLGTEFNVLDRANKTEVVLKSGKIRLTVQQKDELKTLTMQPNQRVEMDTTATKVKLDIVKPEAYTSWQDHRLVFEGTRLSEIAQMLNETYNLKVTVADRRMLDEKISGTIPSGNVQELLNALSIALQLKYTQTNNTIKFY
jgi:transmembrane sensor